MKQTTTEWIDQGVSRLGAALAFYTLFAIAPLFVIMLAIAGLWFGEQAARSELFSQVSSLVGSEGGEAIQALVSAADKPKTGAWATVIAVATLLVGATGVFVQLQDALNSVWGVRRKPGCGLRNFVKDRLLSFALIVGIGFLLLVSPTVAGGAGSVDTPRDVRGFAVKFYTKEGNGDLVIGIIDLCDWRTLMRPKWSLPAQARTAAAQRVNVTGSGAGWESSCSCSSSFSGSGEPFSRAWCGTTSIERSTEIQLYDGNIGKVHIHLWRGAYSIGNPEFDAVLGDLKASLDRLQIPNKEQKELLSIIESTRPQIVTQR